MQFSGRYIARNGKKYEIISRFSDGRHLGAEVIDEHAPVGEQMALGNERFYWDEKGDHPSDHNLDLMELERAGKRYR